MAWALRRRAGLGSAFELRMSQDPFQILMLLPSGRGCVALEATLAPDRTGRRQLQVA